MLEQRFSSPQSARLLRYSALLALAFSLCSLAGCNTAVRAAPLPEALRAETFCVQKHERDVRNFDKIIAKNLKERGFSLSEPAATGQCPSETPYLVSYLDHFSWDLRVFLAKLTIEVTDAETTEILAYGESRQDSLGAFGTTYKDVIDRAIAAMLGEETE